MGNLFTPARRREGIVHGSAAIGVATAMGLVIAGASAVVVWLDPFAVLPPLGGGVVLHEVGPDARGVGVAGGPAVARAKT